MFINVVQNYSYLAEFLLFSTITIYFYPRFPIHKHLIVLNLVFAYLNFKIILIISCLLYYLCFAYGKFGNKKSKRWGRYKKSLSFVLFICSNFICFSNNREVLCNLANNTSRINDLRLAHCVTIIYRPLTFPYLPPLTLHFIECSRQQISITKTYPLGRQQKQH